MVSSLIVKHLQLAEDTRMKIELASEKDAGAILELQKIAFYQRGLDYNNMNLKPLVESLDEYKQAFSKYTCLKAVVDGRIVGSVRASESDGTCYISRLIVHPEYQGRGIGSKLMFEMEKLFRKTVKRFELFTGGRDHRNILTYRNLGYTVFRSSYDGEVPIVYLEKKRINTEDVSICVTDVYREEHLKAIKELVKEYFQWGNGIAIEKYGYDFDVDTMYTDFLNELPKYKYPDGVLNLLEHEGQYFGIGGFKRIDEDTCELKRMFIRENYRGNRFGRLLLRNLIKTAEEYGYREMRLESARFMINAQALYLSNGFREMEVYQGVESPEKYQSIIYCMKRQLEPA